MSDREKPLTEEELERFESMVLEGHGIGHVQLIALFAEVKRLRAVIGDWAHARYMGRLLGSGDIPGGTSYCELEADAADAHEELDRLRSDEWLTAAAEEIYGLFADSKSDLMLIDSILRHHRDGQPGDTGKP